MVSHEEFCAAALRIDPARTVDQITASIRKNVHEDLRRKGVVLGLSGGVDSSVVAALSERALGKDKVLALLMPECESSGESLSLGRLVADKLGIRTITEDITPILKAAGCYRRRDDVIRTLIPEYRAGDRCKIVLPPIADQKQYRLFSIVTESPDGVQTVKRLTADAYRGIVAASNFKQRVRKMMEYYYADLFHYAVLGTPNRLEYDQGFFVKNGDSAADLKPIAHLYKTQVYQLAEYLGIPEEVRNRPPTTDTYSLSQSQEEFYFSLSFDKLDLCLYGKNHGMPAHQVAKATRLTVEEVEYVYRDIAAKRKATRYLHMAPFLVETIDEIVT